MNYDQARFWAHRELECDEHGNRIPRLADCDWPKAHLRDALSECDVLLAQRDAAIERANLEAAHHAHLRAERDAALAECEGLKAALADARAKLSRTATGFAATNDHNAEVIDGFYRGALAAVIHDIDTALTTPGDAKTVIKP